MGGVFYAPPKMGGVFYAPPKFLLFLYLLSVAILIILKYAIPKM